MKLCLQNAARMGRLLTTTVRCRPVGIPLSPLSVATHVRFYVDKKELQNNQYVPEGKVVVDKVTGEKKFVAPMTVHTDLPEHPYRKERKMKFWAFVIFSILMTTVVGGIFQYEKVSSPVMNATMYYLRRSKLARQMLGGTITYSGVMPFIDGELNTVKGNIDIQTKVEGDKSKAKMYLKAGRTSPGEKLRISKWLLVDETSGKTIDLLHDDDSVMLDLS